MPGEDAHSDALVFGAAQRAKVDDVEEEQVFLNIVGGGENGNKLVCPEHFLSRELERGKREQ